MPVTIIEKDAALGAEIRGIDPSGELDDHTFELVRNALYQYSVLILRDCIRDDDAHIRFASRFGRLQPSRNLSKFSDRTHPEIFIISNVQEDGAHIGIHDAGIFWHSDGEFFDKPFGPTALRAIEVPSENGRSLGDTLFASTAEAYEALPCDMKMRIEGLQAVHSVFRRVERTVAAGVTDTPVPTNTPGVETEAVHPVIRVHPKTNRKCIYVSEGYTTRILGLSDSESDALLSDLTMHCARPAFIYRHSWQVNDLVMWDNCSTQHKATFDYQLPQRRLMHRTTLAE